MRIPADYLGSAHPSKSSTQNTKTQITKIHRRPFCYIFHPKNPNIKSTKLHRCSCRPFSWCAPLKDLLPPASSAPQTWRLLIEEDGEDGLDGDGDGDGFDGDGD